VYLESLKGQYAGTSKKLSLKGTPKTQCNREPIEQKSGIRINTEIKKHREKKSNEIREKRGERLLGKVTLPSLEGYMALMHVTPRAKGTAVVVPVKPITQ